MLFQPLPPTRYDLRFSIAGIPVSVHPSFWLISLLFGASAGLLLIPIWVVVVFVSILVHELGHAFAFRRHHQGSHILLYFGGGLTIPEPVSWGSGYASVGLTANQQIFISFAGPATGFLFAALILGIVMVVGGSIGIFWLLGFIPLPLNAAVPFGGWIPSEFIRQLLWVNVFWGLINLMPVYPLDGGSIARNIFVQVDPIDGVRKSIWLSVIAGAIVALIGLVIFWNVFIALLFGLLAFQSYQSLQGRFW